MPSRVDVLRNPDCFADIVRQAPVALLAADGSRILMANNRLQELFGYGDGELLGQSIDSVLLDAACSWPFASAAGGSTAHCAEAVGLRKDGTRVPLEVTTSQLETSEGLITLASMTDTTSRRHSDEAKQRMAAIVESANDAILTKSLDGLIRSWNPGAERLLGYRAEDIIGTSITRLIPSDLQDEEAMILDRIRNGQRVAHFETVRRKHDGTPVDVSLTISPIRDRLGTIVGASKIMRDISDRKRAEENLRRSNSQLERINTDLDEFVYTASHDLRSPLTNVASVAQWILEDDHSLSEQTRDRLVLIQSRIDRMKRLLNDIRDYARSGRDEQTSGARLTARALVGEVIQDLYVPPAFSILCAPELEDIQVAQIPLNQVFHNLIANALKHHDRAAGTVVVSVDVRGIMLRFSVIDDGPGIPQAYREEIFGMFKTLKPRDAMEGSGMGLALVKKLVLRMGGSCGVTPAPGRGSEFWFDWPTLPRTAAAAAP